MFARTTTTIVPGVKVASKLLAVLLRRALLTSTMSIITIAVVTDVMAESQVDSPGRKARSEENPNNVCKGDDHYCSQD